MAFPTTVGVIRTLPRTLGKTSSVPHVCGGDPLAERESELTAFLFLTCVGVIRRWIDTRTVLIPVPHVCGGDPTGS